ncbi:uncharacterized protein LOC123505660 isoform X2 [Portunus trituberculatus]|uniref:uncharacterized protein LOC123505660 isoform X2 n=1 Tax=Portunus trituberculatus TaxID=210409 RepID=UPI001E1CFBCA|nr:uncharacterized protein LOC123505660 isoform X2 [Portunus trituberculatus]
MAAAAAAVLVTLVLSLTSLALADGGGDGDDNDSASSRLEVQQLSGEADFRSIKLHWQYEGDPDEIRLFSIKYCESQLWGKYRCRNKLLQEREARRMKHPGARQQEFEVEVKGLRMATNYTIEVTPVLRGDTLAEAPPMGSEVAVRTKGFSARATQCLANSSVVEVETGPNFGGKISVEGSDDPRCWTQGRRDLGQTTYLLTIDHDLCGSEVHNTSVTSFIIVQENLPILTHSTRRFLVKCNYIPETFTVRAGVSLPNEDDEEEEEELFPVDQAIFELDPSELFDSANNIFDSRLSEDIGKALKMSAEEVNKEPQMLAHLVMMVILVMAAVVGLSCAAWHFFRHSRAQNRQGFMSPQEEPRMVQENESLEAVVRDFGRGEASQEHIGQPVALVSVRTVREETEA